MKIKEREWEGEGERLKGRSRGATVTQLEISKAYISTYRARWIIS